MKLIIEKNYKFMSKKAAHIIRQKIEQKPDCVLGLATGDTPIGTYRELIDLHQQGHLDFSSTKTFNLDEYYGIGMELSKPYQQDQSYARFMHEELFKHINIKKENIHIPDGLAKDPEKHCRSYELDISQAGGIDLQLLGIGGNGHLAFNEPGSSLASRTRLIGLAKNTLNDNYEKFYKYAGKTKENMPRYALTMGIGTILESKQALMLVSGINKSKIIMEAIEGCLASRVPASAMQLYPGEFTIILDKEAASKLTWSLDLAEDNS